MAVDTAAKRLSAMTVGSIPGNVYPTGSVGAAARQDVVGVYRGILAALPEDRVITVTRNRRDFMILFGGIYATDT